MKNILLHTPEGVRDIYGNELAGKEHIEQVIGRKLSSFGYESIETPTFEFFDVFSKEIGTTPSKELYKFFDKEGNTLVLRPDFTPSIARCAAKYYMDETQPIRFCYKGNTFINAGSLQGKLKEITQMGAELMNDDSVEADAEMIALVVESLLQTGLKEFQLSIGEVEYFKGLCEEAGLSTETAEDLRELISGKNLFGAEELLKERNVCIEERERLLKVSDFFGAVEILDEAENQVHNETSKQAVMHLKKLYEVLKAYGVEKYISFDLGMLSKYQYMLQMPASMAGGDSKLEQMVSMMMFSQAVETENPDGVGDAIVKGGRYDKLLGCFGKSAPAIGFAVVIDDLLLSLERQNGTYQEKPVVQKITYTESNYTEKLKTAQALRSEGERVALIPESERTEV